MFCSRKNFPTIQFTKVTSRQTNSVTVLKPAHPVRVSSKEGTERQSHIPENQTVRIIKCPPCDATGEQCTCHKVQPIRKLGLHATTKNYFSATSDEKSAKFTSAAKEHKHTHPIAAVKTERQSEMSNSLKCTECHMNCLSEFDLEYHATLNKGKKCFEINQGCTTTSGLSPPPEGVL